MAEVPTGLVVGQRFTSLEDFKTEIRNISVRQHWDLRVVRSNKKSVVLGCRSAPNCYFRVVCRANKNATYITSLQDTHSCRRNVATPGSTPARSEVSHVRFLLNEIPKLFDMNTKIKGQDVVDAVKRYHRYDISMRQAQRALTKLQPRQGRGSHAQSADTENDVVHEQPPILSPSVRVETETSFDPLTDDRGWPDNTLPSALMEDDTINQDDSPTENTATTIVNSQQNNSPLTTISHHAQPGPSEPRSLSTMPHHPTQITSLTSTGQQFVQPIHLPAPQATPNKAHLNPTLSQPSQPQVLNRPPLPPPPPPPQQQQPQQAAQAGQHPTTSQLVLTNFKIEFTCTSCGALNQSFFPNQGNVAGSSYLPTAGHGLSPTANGRPPTLDAVANETTNNSAGPVGFAEPDYQGNGTSHGRELPPWGSSLEVPIPPTNT